MAPVIHLAVGRLEIDWGKNFGFTAHSALFQISDLAIPLCRGGQRIGR